MKILTILVTRQQYYINIGNIFFELIQVLKIHYFFYEKYIKNNILIKKDT